MKRFILLSVLILSSLSTQAHTPQAACEGFMRLQNHFLRQAIRDGGYSIPEAGFDTDAEERSRREIESRALRAIGLLSNITPAAPVGWIFGILGAGPAEAATITGSYLRDDEAFARFFTLRASSACTYMTNAYGDDARRLRENVMAVHGIVFNDDCGC